MSCLRKIKNWHSLWLLRSVEEMFSKSEFLEKKKILEEDYGLKMSVELEGRMNEMCNVSDYWEEVAL